MSHRRDTGQAPRTLRPTTHLELPSLDEENCCPVITLGQDPVSSLDHLVSHRFAEKQLLLIRKAIEHADGVKVRTILAGMLQGRFLQSALELVTAGTPDTGCFRCDYTGCARTIVQQRQPGDL